MPLLHRVTNYINYLLKAKTVYYLHSPFLFNWGKDVLNNTGEKQTYTIAESIVARYSVNNEKIMLNGTGAKGVKEAAIKNIAALQALPRKHGRLLQRMAAGFENGNIVELGTSLGISSAYLACGNNTNKVVTFEGEPKLVELAKQHHALYGLRNIEYVEGNIDNTLPAFLTNNYYFNLAFIDANHTYEATLRYFNLLLPHRINGSIIIFDDIYWSEGMTKAWQEIKHHPDVRLTIDLYRMGIVFFNPQLSKQDFRLLF